MAILRVKDENGNIIDIPAIVGPKGDIGPQGETGPQGPEGPQGPKGDSGISEEEWQEVVNTANEANTNAADAMNAAISAQNMVLTVEGQTVNYRRKQNVSEEEKARARGNIGAAEETNLITMSGDINVTIQKNTEYTFDSVTSLEITGTSEDAHGFVKFASSVSTISITGFNGASGDDITAAAASEIWEFNCYNGYIIWKNWSV